MNICYGRNYGLCNQEGTHTWKEVTFCPEHYYEIYYGRIIRAFMDNADKKGLYKRMEHAPKDLQDMFLHNALLDCLREAGYKGIV